MWWSTLPPHELSLSLGDSLFPKGAFGIQHSPVPHQDLLSWLGQQVAEKEP